MAAAGAAELRTQPLAAPGSDEVCVRTLFSGISRGTEALVLAGRVPHDEWQVMRAPFQAGGFEFPVKYGYASVGVVESGPAALVGRSVFCLYPHQDRYVVPVSAVVPLPDAVPPHRAVLAANMETALNIVWDACIAPGDRVAVIGAGVVGGLVAAISAGIPGVEVTLVDIDSNREQLATMLGCGFALPPAAPTGCDVVIHASATAAGLGTALACAGFEATVVEASWYGDAAVSVSLGGAFHSQRLRLVSSQVGHVPPARRARWTARRRLEKALELLDDERLDTFISGETAFAGIAEAYCAILADPATLCHRIRYS